MIFSIGGSEIPIFHQQARTRYPHGLPKRRRTDTPETITVNAASPENPPPPPQQPPRAGSHHTILAISAAGVALVIVLILALSGSGRGDFAGREEAVSMAKMIRRMDATQFEAVNIRTDAIGDWILTKGFDGFRAPPALANVTVNGRTTTKSGQAPVVVLMLDNDARRVAVFQAAPAGIEIPEDGQWRAFELPQTHNSRDAAVAVSADNGICFVITAPGKARDLERWLEDKSKQNH